jgi:AraC-like DNA-binding protein
MYWSAACVQAVGSDTHLAQVLFNICDGVPDRITGAAYGVNTEMRTQLAALHQMNFGALRARDPLHREMKKYLFLLLREIKEQQSLKIKMRSSDWESINEAKRLIETENKPLSTPELAVLIGMNEYKLKRLFPQVTGFKVDEYRKHRLYTMAGKKIIQSPDEPLKNFFEEAGYTTLTSFVRAFRKTCYCTPGELRSDTWNLSGMPQNMEE